MDTSSFFNYPTASQPAETPQLGLLPDATEEDWDTLLAHMETLRFAAGDVVIAGGEPDRALYLLSDGRLQPLRAGGPESRPIEAPATIGEAAFLDGRPRAVSVKALTSGELLRLGYDSFESLAARHPRLARELLLDVGRVVAAKLRAAGDQVPDWTG